MQEQHSMHLRKPHLHISHIRSKHCQRGLQVSLSPDLTALLTDQPHLRFVVLLGEKKGSLDVDTSLAGHLIHGTSQPARSPSPLSGRSGPLTSPHHPNLSCSWSTAEITSRTSPSQALSLRACHVGQVPVMSQRGSNNPRLWPGDRGADPQHWAQLQLMPSSPRPLAQQHWLDTANHKVGHASPAGGLAFSDECPCHFCCPKFHLQAKVGLLWKSLHRQGWEEFLGEQANPNAAVSLLQGCVAAQQHLAYTGWGYPSFQTWVTQVHHYKQDPTFKRFPSRSGFSLCASGVAVVN